jgi:hypothetical protein
LPQQISTEPVQLRIIPALAGYFSSR